MPDVSDGLSDAAPGCSPVDDSSLAADAVMADLAMVLRCRCCLPKGTLFGARSEDDDEMELLARRPLLSRSDFLGS